MPIAQALIPDPIPLRNMNANMTFKRITAAAAGVLFLIVGGLILVGFGGLGQYGIGVRVLMALLVLGYGLMRIWSAFKSGPREP